MSLNLILSLWQQLKQHHFIRINIFHTGEKEKTFLLHAYILLMAFQSEKNAHNAIIINSYYLQKDRTSNKKSKLAVKQFEK